VSAHEWLETAFERIDAANAEDPVHASWAGEDDPKELLHAWRAGHWLTQLAPSAGPAVRLALRAHHLERWRCPRDAHPMGRPGYLRWRKEAQRFHAERLAELLAGVPVPSDVLARAQALVRKERAEGPLEGAQRQVFEDVLCLVFLEQQLAAFAGTLEGDKLRSILAKTLPKMSAEAIGHAAALPLDAAHLDLLRELVAELG